MKRSYKTILALTLAMTVLFAGCSANRSSERADIEEIRAHNASAEVVGVVGDYDPGTYSAEAVEEMDTLSYNMGAGYDTAPASGSGTDSVDELTESDAVNEGRMLIRYVTVSCETVNFTELTSNIESQVAQLGGYIESKNFSGTGSNNDLRTASYTIRVTSDNLDQLVNMVGGNAIITSSNESTEDVTLSYADTQARIESLRTEQETLNNLLAEADDLDIILQLQNELTYIRYEIESYESQLRVLENLSSYSTLTLYVNEVLEETEPEEAHVKTFSEKLSESFHNGLKDAKEKWEDFVIDLAGSVIPLSVTIVFVVAGIIIIKIVVKKIKRKMSKKETTPVNNDDKKEVSEKKG